MPWSFIISSFSIVASIMVRLPVIALSPHVGVQGDDLLFRLGVHVLQLPLQKRFDAFVVVRLEIERPYACLLHPFGRIELRKPYQAEAAPIAVLRMFPVLHDRLHEHPRIWPYLLAPRLDPLGRPFEEPPVVMGHVELVGDEGARLVDPHMGGDPFAPVVDLHDGVRVADVDLLADERVGDAVVGLLDVDMVIDVDRRLLPGGDRVAFRGKGRSAGLSISRKRSCRDLPMPVMGRSFSLLVSSAMAALSSARLKNVLFR